MRAQVRERELLAYLPHVTEGGLKQPVRDEQLGQLRRVLYHWCQTVILAPLKPLSHLGIRLTDPDGIQAQVFPELLTYVCDHPEAMLISGIMNSPQTRHPCDQCWVPREQLHEVSVQHRLRDETEQQANYQKIVSKTLRAADVSQHPVACGHWGFFGGKTEFGVCTGNDFMHNEVGRCFLIGVSLQVWAPEPRSSHLYNGCPCVQHATTCAVTQELGIYLSSKGWSHTRRTTARQQGLLLRS